jgi:hypothetical protein
VNEKKGSLKGCVELQWDGSVPRRGLTVEYLDAAFQLVRLLSSLVTLVTFRRMPNENPANEKEKSTPFSSKNIHAGTLAACDGEAALGGGFSCSLPRSGG